MGKSYNKLDFGEAGHHGPVGYAPAQTQEVEGSKSRQRLFPSIFFSERTRRERKKKDKMERGNLI